MAQFDPPALAARDLVLEFDDRAVRAESVDPDDTKPIVGRLMLGGPAALALDAGSPIIADDPVALAYVRAQSASHDFHLVRCTPTFVTGPSDPPFVNAIIWIWLSAEEGEPSAFSMAPTRISHPIKRAISFHIGPELSITGVADIKLGAADYSTEYAADEVFLEALGGQTAKPGWQFHSTASSELTGEYELAMVVRSPRGAKVTALTTLSACVRKRQLLWYRTQAVDPIVIAGVVS